MVFTFFDDVGLIYTHYAQVGAKINVNYLINILATFWCLFRQKRPILASTGDWLLHWDNFPLHTAKITKEWLKKKEDFSVGSPLYSPDLAPADFFFFPT